MNGRKMWSLAVAAAVLVFSLPIRAQLLNPDSVTGAFAGGLFGGMIAGDHCHLSGPGAAIGAGVGFLLGNVAYQSRAREAGYYAVYAPPAYYPASTVVYASPAYGPSVYYNYYPRAYAVPAAPALVPAAPVSSPQPWAGTHYYPSARPAVRPAPVVYQARPFTPSANSAGGIPDAPRVPDAPTVPLAPAWR